MADDTLAHGDPLPGDPRRGAVPRVVGPYVLVRRLGEGGMGEVWLADQTEPIRRTVALKLIKAGMDTRRVVARFEAERQALAMMDHPAIARVLDGGSTAEGRPYFVMELVEGAPLLEYCDTRRLSTRRRLELFVAVCEGVQHAHQKAVIHRDLKPSNVLVVTVDGRPQPRIIDFGIAKAMSQRLGENALETEIGVLVGTPGYMSPEQADPTGADVDTRTDVDSLGVMLYELLTGLLPFDRPGPAGADPPPPSARLLASKDAGSTATNRGTTRDALAREIRGDLDAIVLKAMDAEREGRYASVADLAGDLGRALRNEPVAARPASTLYRVRKYVRRHRTAVAIGAAVALLLPAFTVTLAVQVRRVSHERDRANREAAAATRIAGFLSGIFKVSDPSEARGNSLTAREALDRAAREIETGLDRDPELQAQLMATMGSIYGDLGLPGAARPLLQRALETRTRLLANDLYEQGNLAEAAELQLQVLQSSRRVYGPEHPNTLAAMSNVANTRAAQKDFGEAERINREILAIELKARGPGGRAAGIARYNLLCEAALQHHRDDAMRYLREAVQCGIPEEIVKGIDQDSDLEWLRGDRTYEGLVAQLKERPSR